MTKQISHAARALAIGVVAALVLTGTAQALSNSGGGNWQYYKEITIKENSGSTLTDYQVLVQLSGSNFPTNMRSDGADIRLTDASGNELSYWIESWDYYGKNANIWVKVPSITASATAAIKMYYGNPSASTVSSGDTTFILFDDFDGTNLNANKWISEGIVSVNNGMVQLQNDNARIISKSDMPESFVYHSKHKHETSIEPSFYSMIYASTNYDSDNLKTGITQKWDNYYDILIADYTSSNQNSLPFTIQGGVWYYEEVKVEKKNNGDVSVTFMQPTTLSTTRPASSVPQYRKIFWNVYGGNNDGWIDWIFVRKYASFEPLISLGIEQPVLKEQSTTTTTVPPAKPSVSKTGIVAEWYFDGDAKDSSGNGYDGILKNGATFGTGISGQALSLDGVDDYVDVGDASGNLAFDASREFYTVGMWFKINQFSNSYGDLHLIKDEKGDKCSRIVKAGDPRSCLQSYALGISRDTKKLGTGIYDDLLVDYGIRKPFNNLWTPQLSSGIWYYVVLVVKANQVQNLYLNGNLVASESINGIGNTKGDTGGGLYIGAGFYRGDGRWQVFNGLIDEVQIYNRALSADEIKANYDSIIGKSPITTATKPASSPTSAPATPAPTTAQTTIPTPAPTAAPESSNSYVYAGIGGIILLLVAIVALKRRSSSKVEEPLKREPTAKPEPQKPEPLTEPPKSKPAPMTVPEAPGVYVKTAFGYKGAAIIYKLKIENNTSDPISDIKVYPYVPDVFLLKEKEKSIALIEPKSSQTVTFEIRPTGECGDCNVSGRVNYYNTASRKRLDIELEQKSLSIVCPMLHGKEITETEWYDAVGNLVKTEESTREIGMPAESLFTMVSRVIKDMHMHMQKPEVTQNHKLFNGVARFYGEGVKGLKYAAQVEVVGGAKKSKLILKVWAEKEDALTGFYHGMLDEIEKRVNVKEYIDDSIVQYNVHIGDKIGTQIKDSVVQRSTIGASMRKCPDCGREVEANEKFCLECGAKL